MVAPVYPTAAALMSRIFDIGGRVVELVIVSSLRNIP
jgi:hypothetical protein